MALKEFLTTREAAKLLNISQSTVSRKFDRGVLFGKKNPITGERFVSRESITAFMKKYNLSMEGLALQLYRVLLGTPDDQLASFIQKTFAEDKRIQIERMGFGCDLLIRCSKERSDLLILDEDLPDISTAEVIKSIRRMEEMKDLKILCFSKTKTNRALEWGADEVLSKEKIEEGPLTRKIYTLLNLSIFRPDQEQIYKHKRRWPRAPINVPAKIRIYRRSSPNLLGDPARTVLENISSGGAYLNDIRLRRRGLPGVPFGFLLEVDHPPFKGLEVHCKVVRLESNGALAAGVQFMNLSQEHQRMVESVFQ